MHRHLPGHARARCSATPRGSASTSSHGGRRRRGPAVRGRVASTSCSATRCCTTCPTSTRAFGEFHRVLQPGRRVVFAGEPSRYGDRLAASPSAAPCALAPLWRAALARARRAPAHTAQQRRRGDHALEALVDVHAFDARRARRLARRRRASSDVRVTRRGAAGELVRLGQPRAGGHRRPRRRAVAVAPVRLPRLPRAPARRPRACSRAACRRRSSTTSCSRRGSRARAQKRQHRGAAGRGGEPVFLAL